MSPFFIGAGPITHAQWAAVVMNHPDKLSYALQPFPSFFKGDGLPLESITWDEADESAAACPKSASPTIAC
jgi:formylglycine-generating enzyme required for sulfatase activity